ncbi:Hemerythrin domain protein [Citrifermentans bremense]|uniref:Hemerythrin domain protein n=1 Tax=Citrifermentans bremense TaxID=60035 RepID=A0A6S6M5F5_9BACT|nr:hemerythrin domain-containing protein [Citrifermentans bremense]BCG46934.1 Hemerythrin domain protein [Citrifermentans bremense]
MARLIDELKKDHVEIDAMLAKVRDSKVTNQEAHKILIAAKGKLLAHLKKEDIQLYPVLNKAAVNDATLKRSVDFYAKDMQEITADAIAFFDKYSPADAAIDIEFARAFGRLYSILARRLRSEESTLYPAYEKLHPL